MTLLHSNAIMSTPSPRIVAAGAFACMAESWQRAKTGGCRPFPRDTFVA